MVQSPAPDRFPAAGGEIVITTFTHSSLQIEHAGKVIHVDPWSLGDMPQAKPADLILITDDPPHHLDVTAIAKLRRAGAPVVMPASGKSAVPDGIVLPNGSSTVAAGISVESIAAYDIKPGAPEHPKGAANGYLLTLGGKRLYLAGVTECVPELRALKNIDIAFMPMNIPPNRMTPPEVAECVKALKPKTLYVYHFDQDYSRALTAGEAARPAANSGMRTLIEALKGEPVDVRDRNWYPPRPARQR